MKAWQQLEGWTKDFNINSSMKPAIMLKSRQHQHAGPMAIMKVVEVFVRDHGDTHILFDCVAQF